jgi:hypothetical protein
LPSCDGGIFDLDFDQSCNAWGVTMISGTDYLRKITPQGAVSEYAGVTNLNMGEVAAIQGASGTFGGGLSDVALTYICCATCGCILTSSAPQGVAALEQGALPDARHRPVWSELGTGSRVVRGERGHERRLSRARPGRG